MITKERLEQLKKQGADVYTVNLNTRIIVKLRTKFISLNYDGTELYETEAEAQWHADNDAERTEYFCPPMEYDDEWECRTVNGKCKIDYDGYGYYVQEWNGDDYLNEEFFDTYPEAVAYARKLFKGEVK